MSPSRNSRDSGQSQPVKPDERAEQIRQLEEQVAHAERHGQFDTAHHQMLRRLKEAVKDGEPNIQE